MVLKPEIQFLRVSAHKTRCKSFKNDDWKKKEENNSKLRKIGICKIIIYRILFGWWCFVSLLQKKKGLNSIAVTFELVSHYMIYHNRRSGMIFLSHCGGVESQTAQKCKQWLWQKRALGSVFPWGMQRFSKDKEHPDRNATWQSFQRFIDREV